MNYDAQLRDARAAATLACEYLRREYAAFAAVPDAPVTISTHADKGSQELILGFLRERYPEYALCAEENTPAFDAVPKSGPRAWVVDPIDGTRGFAKKTGQFSVMIGLLVDGAPVVGVVAEPAQNRYTFAALGGGCWTHFEGSEPARCAVSARGFADLVLVQSPAKSGMSPRPVRALEPARVLETYSGGVKLAAVARGDADAYANVYETFCDWDIAAGHLLVTEAGGTVTDLSGAPIVYQGAEFKQKRGLLATNGPIHADARARLAATQ